MNNLFRVIQEFAELFLAINNCFFLNNISWKHLEIVGLQIVDFGIRIFGFSYPEVFTHLTV